MIRLYHGSISSFTSIDLSKGKGYKDFGRGFYASIAYNHAANIAKRKQVLEKQRFTFFPKATNQKTVTAFVYNLLFDEMAPDLDILRFTQADSQWLRFIIDNRMSQSHRTHMML